MNEDSADSRHVRRGRGKPRRGSRQRAVPTDAVLGELVGDTAEAVNQLSPELRVTVLLAAAQSYTRAEIADMLRVSPHTVKMRLYVARKRVSALLEEWRQAAPALLLASRRCRLSLWERLHGLVSAMAPQGFAATALIPLVAWSLGVTAPSPAVALRDSSAPTLAFAAQALPDPPAAANLSDGGHRSTPGRTTHDTSSAPALFTSARGAAAETPEDVRITTAAVPPRAAGAGPAAMVAIGWGRTCLCSVLLQSLDGGRSWAATDGPPVGVNQIVLPPQYPTDPRIFGSTAPLGGSPSVASSFGQPFTAIGGLPGGRLAVSARFDSGDPRLFAAGETGIWSVAMAGSDAVGTAHLDLTYSPTEGGPATLATPVATSADSPAVLAWAPALAAVPASLTAPRPSSALYECPVASPCVALADLPVPPWQLAVGSVAPGAVLAYGTNVALLSHDGGRSFTRLSLPHNSAQVYSAALVGRQAVPWVTVVWADGSPAVLRLSADGGWIDATGTDATVRQHVGVVLLAVDDHRVLDALNGAGYRCAISSGGPWLPRCPA